VFEVSRQGPKLVLVCAVPEGSCAFVNLCERRAVLSQDEEVIIICGGTKWGVSVTSHCCLVILGGSVKEVIKVLASAFLHELSFHANVRVAGMQR
jgi:hypothetical protein